MYFILWLILALLVGKLATGRKIGFWGGFLLSVFLTPLVGLIAALVSDKKQPGEQKEQRGYMKGKPGKPRPQMANVNVTTHRKSPRK